MNRIDKYPIYKDFVEVKTTLENDKYIIEAVCDKEENMCPFCKSKDIIRNGNKVKRVLDIPYYDKPAIIFLTHQRWLCNSCNKTFWSSEDSIDEKHYMTKRLFDYIVSRLLEEKPSVIADEVFTTTRTLTNLRTEFINRNYNDRIPNTLFLYKYWDNKKEIYLIIDGDNKEPIEIRNSKNKIMERLKQILEKSSYINKIIVPADTEIIKTIANSSYKNKVSLDERSYNLFINTRIFNEYLVSRKQHRDEIKTTLKRESKLFFTPKDALTCVELDELTYIKKKNQWYAAYCYYRDSILERRLVTNIQFNVQVAALEVSSPSFSCLERINPGFINEFSAEIANLNNLNRSICSDYSYHILDLLCENSSQDLTKIDERLLPYKYRKALLELNFE